MQHYHANTIYKYHLRGKKKLCVACFSNQRWAVWFFFVATRVTNYLRKWRVYSKYPSDIILVTNLY